MLKEITIKNFRSFNEEVTFTMEADCERVSEFKNHIVEKCNNKLLKVSSIYGPNGGGKTNLIKAIALPKYLLMTDNSHLQNNEIKCVFSDDDEIEETLFFVTDQYEIGFNFAITSKIEKFELLLGNEKINNFKNHISIVKERVVYRLRDKEDFSVLCSRDYTGKIISKTFDHLGIKMINLAKSKLVLSKMYDEYANTDFVDSMYIDILKKLYEEIKSIIPLDSNFVHSLMNEDIMFLIEKYKEKLVKNLNDADIKISDIKIYSDRPSSIYFERIIECNGKKIIKEIPLKEESSGTQKIFEIFVKLLLASNRNMIFYCDDMNYYLHPKLFRAVIELFNSKENKNQLIFNSHDITNMTNELFRRDEIWFAYRDDNYSTKLVPLSNMVNYNGEQIRKDAKYNKQYLEGRFGADPFIKKGLNWYE